MRQGGGFQIVKPKAVKGIAKSSKDIKKEEDRKLEQKMKSKWQAQYLYTGSLKGMPKDMRVEFAQNKMLGVLNPIPKYGNPKMDSSYKAAVTKGIREAYGGDREAISDLQGANKDIRKAQKEIHDLAINSGGYRYSQIPRLYNQYKNDLIDGLPTHIWKNGTQIYRGDKDMYEDDAYMRKQGKKLEYRAKDARTLRLAKKWSKEVTPAGQKKRDPLRESDFTRQGPDSLVDRYTAISRDKKRDKSYAELKYDMKYAEQMAKARKYMTKEGYKDFVQKIKDNPGTQPQQLVAKYQMKEQYKDMID